VPGSSSSASGRARRIGVALPQRQSRARTEDAPREHGEPG
jgi:hypothetical protein